MTDFNVFQAFLPPFVPVELPSKGLLYPEGFLPQPGWVHIREYAAPEEALLSSMNGENAQMVLNQIIKSCIQEKIDVEQLTNEDVFYLLVWLRANSYSTAYDVEATCPYRDCGFPSIYPVNLATDLRPIIYLKEGVVEPLVVTLPKSQATVYIRAMRRSMEMRAQKRQADVTTWRNYHGDPLALLKRAYAIDKVLTHTGEEITNRLDIERLCLNYLPASDSLAIDTALQTFAHGIDTRISLTCTKCGRMIYTNLPISQEFFRPTVAVSSAATDDADRDLFAEQAR
jgi:hypothetical protein